MRDGIKRVLKVFIVSTGTTGRQPVVPLANEFQPDPAPTESVSPSRSPRHL